MSKKAIVDERGNISDVCEAEDAFPIYEGDDATCVWMDVPDDFVYDVEDSHVINGSFVHIRKFETPSTLTIARTSSYGDLGAQLDMQYHDKVDGTSTWEDHVTAVKTANKKPSLAKDTDQEVIDEEGDPGRPEPHWKKI